MADAIDRRGARLADADWDALVTAVLDAPDLGRIDLTGAGIDAEHLAAILAAAPPGCVVAREVDAYLGRFELGPRFQDWSTLWAFVEPVLARWSADLADLADRLGDEALGDDLADLGEPFGDDPDDAAETRFHALRSDRLPRLVEVARRAPAIAAYAREAGMRTQRLYAACFEGDAGDDFPRAVAAWAELVPALAGAIRCWRGDGGDAPAWDRDAADEIRRLVDV